MKITILTQNLSVGGIQRLVVDEANELHRRGDEVHVITFEAEKPGNTLAPELRIPKENVIYIPYLRMRELRGFFSLVRTLKHVQPEVLFTHHWFANTVGRLAAFIVGIPMVFSFEHSTYEKVNPPRQFFFDRTLQGLSKKIIAVSEAVRHSLVKNGINPNRIVVIPNGIDLSRYQRTSVMGERKTFQALFIGRLVFDKGADVFIRALLRAEGAEGIIAGDGPERASLESLVREHGLGKRIRFLGVVNNVPDILASADCVVVPSRREGFGLVAVEALAAGLPVIATRVGGLPDIIKEDINGLLVPPSDSEGLTHAICRLMEDRRLYTALSNHATADVVRFSIRDHIDRLLSSICAIQNDG